MTSVFNMHIDLCCYIGFLENHSKLVILMLFYLRFSFSLVYGGINIPLKKNYGFLQGNKEGGAKKIGKYLF